MSERKKLIYMLLVFMAAYFMPVGWPRFQSGIFEAFALVRWYAREHVLLCLVPAFFIAGALSALVPRETITRYLAEHGELLCPHTAVGANIGEKHLGTVPMVTLATAHPAKFPAAVEAATGIHPPLPPRMADLYDRPERITRSKGDLVAIQKIIKDRITS